MTLTEYIITRILALEAAGNTEHDGIHREETPSQRNSRIDELRNLLAAMSGAALTELHGSFPDMPEVKP